MAAGTMEVIMDSVAITTMATKMDTVVSAEVTMAITTKVLVTSAVVDPRDSVGTIIMISLAAARKSTRRTSIASETTALENHP